MAKENLARILIADDDKDFGGILAEHLSELGHSVTVADDGTKALEIFRQSRFDIVLSDLHMPEMDGLELLDRIVRLNNGNTAVIVITGYGSIESAVKAIKGGAYDFITKPVRMDTLGVIIDRALERGKLKNSLLQARGIVLLLLVLIPLWLFIGYLFTLRLL